MQRPHSVLITGGCRSGKSRYAIARWSQAAGQKIFLATAEAKDQEMAQRIRRHRDERGAQWTTLEEPEQPGRIFSRNASKASVILLDCLTLWVANLMMRNHSDESILSEASHLLAAIRPAPCITAVVTNEVGLGMVPHNELALRFCSLAGKINQRFAAGMDEVVLLVAGVPVVLK
ncbi:MAG: bifunctional adenosylcobinamide kinase/adenosylcobinamide-phosphate guanylyltransferase [Nitrospinaceae bacterium]